MVISPPPTLNSYADYRLVNQYLYCNFKRRGRLKCRRLLLFKTKTVSSSFRAIDIIAHTYNIGFKNMIGIQCNAAGPTKDIPIMVDVVCCGNCQVYMLEYAVRSCPFTGNYCSPKIIFRKQHTTIIIIIVIIWIFIYLFIYLFITKSRRPLWISPNVIMARTNVF